LFDLHQRIQRWPGKTGQIALKRSWGGEVKNVSVLVAFGVNQEGYREILGVAEGAKEDKASWSAFLRYLKERGVAGHEKMYQKRS
jgi:transposase-like protein